MNLLKWAERKVAEYHEKKEKGDIDISGILLMGIGMVFLAVGFIVFPIVTDATDGLLAYAYTPNGTMTDANFTGFTAIVGITPLLVLIGYLTASVFAMFLGIKVIKGTGESHGIDLGALILLALSMVFLAIGLIIMPVTLDGISSVLHNGGSGLAAAYSGLESILWVTPLLILISFVTGTVVTGYLGIKKLGA